MEGDYQIGVSRLLELDMAAFGRTCNESSALEGSYRVATGDSGEACRTRTSIWLVRTSGTSSFSD